MTPGGEFREAVRRLHRAKDAAYRDAWKRRGEVISILANIARKVDRLLFTGLAAVRRYLDGRDIEIVPGDITATRGRLEGEDLVLTVIDTDNYTPARAAIDVVRDRPVPGGAIVFGHFTGTDRFRYTLGERMAARMLLDDPRWFHLHGTGVFYRQQVTQGAGR